MTIQRKILWIMDAKSANVVDKRDGGRKLMQIVDAAIDEGKAFDWGRTSRDYAKYRDVYPKEFYERITGRNLCVKGQKVLDLGTGTGVLPRNMYAFGADWTGTDISEEQIAQAKRLAKECHQDIEFLAVATENISFPDNTFDVITACQCFYYFDKEQVIPKLAKMLKRGGKLLVLYMAWLPLEDFVAAESEKLILKYNPKWSGAGKTRHSAFVSEHVHQLFETVHQEEYDVDVPFTRETWNGRVKACRGVGASLSTEEVATWEKEHKALLDRIIGESFSVKHQVRMLELRKI